MSSELKQKKLEQDKLKVAILTSPNQWFIPYAKELESKIPNAKLYFSHEDFAESYNVVFILSYHRLIPQEFLDLYKTPFKIKVFPFKIVVL